MVFTLLNRLGFPQKTTIPLSELDGLSDRLLRDIGYSADGRPLNPETGEATGRPLPAVVERLAPAMLLLALH